MDVLLNGSTWNGVVGAVAAAKLDVAWRRWSSNNPELAKYAAASASVALSVSLVALSVFAGWWLMWVTTLRKIMVVRELLGMGRKPDEQQRKATEDEIRRVKSLHGREQSSRAGELQ